MSNFTKKLIYYQLEDFKSRKKSRNQKINNKYYYYRLKKLAQKYFYFPVLILIFKII